ncbi:MAG: dihydroorotase [Bacillota bacterium]
MKLLIKNGHVVDAKTGKNEICDILAVDGKIAEISAHIDVDGCEVIDASGKHVLPGLVDAHCHLRDPGQEYKEDIASGSRSAAAGGFTSIACMPNTSPAADNEAVIKYIINKARQEACVNVYPIGAVTKGRKGEEIAEIGELKYAGAVALSDDGNPVSSSSVMKKALLYASMFDLTIISHCEDKDLAEDGVMNEGYLSSAMGLKGIPAAAEEAMVARDLILSGYLGIPVHIAHVSTALSVELIRNAKKRGVKVTCETCPHYFSLTEEACEGYNTNAKVNPPLRTAIDVQAIIEGIADDTIDIIATDHAPHHEDEKNVEFSLAANGMVGFETALPLSVTNLVKPGIITLSKLVEKMSLNPARLLNIDKGSLEVGKTADITIIDLEDEITIDVEKFHSKSKNSPFGGMKLTGSVWGTIVNGRPVLLNKTLL